MISKFIKTILPKIFWTAAVSAQATILSDSFLGLEQGALQGALPGRIGNDPFQSISNPAWAPEFSGVGVLHTSVLSHLNGRAAPESTSQLMALALQERKDSLSYGFFAMIPTGAQPILDTGDPLERSSPWMNMNRQLVYAGNFSKSFLSQSLRIGVLIPVTFDADAMAKTRLETADVQSRASVSLKPRLSWALGAHYRPASMENWGFSLFYKEPSRAQVRAEIEGNVPLLTLDLNFQGESAYAFDPRRISVNIVHDEGPWSLGLRGRYSQWSKYALPFVVVTNATLDIEDTTPAGKAQNTWDLALGAERALGERQVLAFSLGWKQSPFKNIEMFHDADHYILGMGWMIEFSKIWSVSTTVRFHALDQGVLYTWAGLGLGYRL